MTTLIIVLAFCFGSAIGSFLNVVILRLPHGQKLNGRSHCPHCGRVLGVLDLFPLLSFAVLAGKCRQCGAKISPRYFLIELLVGLLFVWATVVFFPSSLQQILLLARLLFILCVLTVIFVVDLEHYLILDNVLITGCVGVVIFDVLMNLIAGAGWGWSNFLVLALAMAVLCPLPFWAIWYGSKGRWMGFGDVKLAGFLGLALGWPLCFVGIFLGIFLGGITGLGLLASGKKQLRSQVPFGTFLALGSALALFYGTWLLQWYLSIMGLKP